MKRTPFTLTLIYFALGLLWILLSDFLLMGTLLSQADVSFYSMVKGSLFVVFTSILLFFLMKYYAKSIKEKIEQDKILFKKSPNPMLIFDEETHQILAANEMATSVYGYTQEEFLSMNIVDLRPAEDIEKIAGHHLNRPAEEYFTGTWSHKKKDGSLFHVNIYTQPIEYKNKKARYTSNIDIQEKYLADQKVCQLTQELKDREVYLSSLIDSQSNFMLRTDLAGNVTFANKAFYQKFGFSEEEILGHSSLNTVVPEDQEEVKLKAEECLRHPGRVVSMKIGKPDKQGNRYVTHWEFIALTNAEGETIEIQCMGQDVTQEHSYYQELLETKEKLENILAAVDDIVWAVDAKTLDTIFINKACIKITGYNQQDFYDNNQLWLNIAHPEDQEYLKRGFRQLTPTRQREVEYKIYHQDGSIREVRLKALLKHDAEGNPHTIIGTTVDITAQKKVIKQIKEREKFIDHILNTIPGMVYIHKPRENKTHFLNLNVLTLLGLEDSTYTSLPENILHDLCHPDDRDLLQEHYQKLERDASLSKIHEKIIRVNSTKKSVKWLLLSEVRLQHEEEGRMDEILGIATDITALRENERQVRQTSEKLELAVQIAQLGICYFDPNKGSLLLDDTTRDILGETKQELSWATFLSHVEPMHRNQVTDTIAAQEDTKREKISFSYIDPDNRIKYLKAVFSPYAEEKQGNILIGVIFDETKEKEKEKSLAEKNKEITRTNQQVAEYKLMALQSIMNPHFLFNSLNSIQFLIVKRQREDALNYLSLFSKLLRKVIESSVSGYVMLSEEIEMLTYYVQLEQLRFEDKFTFYIEVDPALNINHVRIPPLLIQPFVENAIIHGINNKKGQRKLEIHMRRQDNRMVCTVEDDGIGREKAMQIKASKPIKYASVGVMLTEERLQLINKNYPVAVEIEDLFNDQGEASGTRVHINLEINHDK